MNHIYMKSFSGLSAYLMPPKDMFSRERGAPENCQTLPSVLTELIDISEGYEKKGFVCTYLGVDCSGQEPDAAERSMVDTWQIGQHRYIMTKKSGSFVALENLDIVSKAILRKKTGLFASESEILEQENTELIENILSTQLLPYITRMQNGGIFGAYGYDFNFFTRNFYGAPMINEVDIAGSKLSQKDLSGVMDSLKGFGNLHQLWFEDMSPQILFGEMSEHPSLYSYLGIWQYGNLRQDCFSGALEGSVFHSPFYFVLHDPDKPDSRTAIFLDAHFLEYGVDDSRIFIAMKDIELLPPEGFEIIDF